MECQLDVRGMDTLFMFFSVAVFRVTSSCTRGWQDIQALNVVDNTGENYEASLENNDHNWTLQAKP